MKERLDVLLVQEGLAQSREKAKAVIMSGCVYVNDQKEDKAGAMFDASKARIEVRGNTLRYVSRGGLKLEKAIERFGIGLAGAVCMDIGASTGGFTDCLLKRGAVRVYAVDCGTDQLDISLRSDPRVISIENFNARELTAYTFGEYVDIAVMDLSFISQTLVLPAVAQVVKDGGKVVSLVKPQFECGRAALSKGGIVKKVSDHIVALQRIMECADATGLAVAGATVSPILGGDGNKEYLMHFIKNGGSAVYVDFEELVRR